MTKQIPVCVQGKAGNICISQCNPLCSLANTGDPSLNCHTSMVYENVSAQPSASHLVFYLEYCLAGWLSLWEVHIRLQQEISNLKLHCILTTLGSYQLGFGADWHKTDY